MNQTPTRVALVTSSNRGLGLAIVRGLAARGLRTVLTGRTEHAATTAAEPLIAAGLPVTQPCQRRRAGHEGAPEVPASFWVAPAMAEALASRHVGRIVRAYRHHPWHPVRHSQDLVARWGHTAQATLSRMEMAATAPQDLGVLTLWSRTLRIPPEHLW